MAVVLFEGYRRNGVKEKSRTPSFSEKVPLLETIPLTIVPGIHMLGAMSPATVYVVETSEGLVLIDSGLDAEAGFLKQQMADLKLDWKRVHAILLTHAHADHVGGARHLREQTGAKIYAGWADAQILKAGGPREALFCTYEMPKATVRPMPVDVELKGDEVVALGDSRFRALATPGHTPGGICFLMERDGLRVLFSGDVIHALIGDKNATDKVTRPFGTYSAYLAPRYRGNAREFLTSLQQLRSLPVPDLVLPGHPRLDPVPPNPALSQERWEELLDSGIREMQQLLARYERDGALFLDGTAKRLLPDLYYLGDFAGAAVYGFFRGGKFFVVGQPRGPGLAEFLHGALKQLGVKPGAPTAVLLTSCDAAEIVGLKDLVAQCHPQVVVSSEARQQVVAACPAGTIVLPAEELPGKGWFDVKSLKLGGRGVGPIAYDLAWADKSVLFSGKIPIRIKQSTVADLSQDIVSGRGNLRDYYASLLQLRELRPNLWLPAVSSDGQNANLYDTEWAEILAGNLRVR
jgi:metallo-beta-lactamase class B